MPSNLTDVDEFTEFVVVPNDTEPANAASLIQGFQPLANRTRNLKNRLDPLEADLPTKVTAASARYDFATGTTTPIPLTEIFADEGFSIVGGNSVQVPSAGRYRVSWYSRMTSENAGSPVTMQLILAVDGQTNAIAETKRWNTTTSDSAFVTGSTILDITDPPNQLISVRLVNDQAVTSLANLRALAIDRVSP